MVSLVDLAPLRKKVELRGQEIEFRGLSLKFLTDLLSQSNELRLLLAEKAISGDLVSTLIADLPEMVAQCIAAANGKPGDAETIGFILVELSPAEWLECLEAIFELTFPKGVRNFVEALTRAGRSLGIDVPGWEAGTKSPEPSPESLLEDTLPRPLGNIPPANSEPSTKSIPERDTASS